MATQLSAGEQTASAGRSRKRQPEKSIKSGAASDAPPGMALSKRKMKTELELLVIAMEEQKE